MLHRNARRDFSVEIKSPGRRNATIIPTREPKPARMRSKPLGAESAEKPLEEAVFAKPAVKPAQAGRILQSLIVQEEPPAIEAAPEPKARRPYTRRAKPAPAPALAMPAPIAAPIAKPAPVKVAPPLVRKSPDRKSPDRKRGAARDAAPELGLGQRWKRRLSRWSR